MPAKRAMASPLEHSKGAPGHGLNGIRLNLAGMPAISRASALASAGWSLTPFSMTYSKVMRRALSAPGYSRQACSRSLIGYFLLIGTRTSRSSSVAACKLTASLTPSSAPTRRIIGTTPEVDSVIRRREMAMPSWSMAMRRAAATLS